MKGFPKIGDVLVWTEPPDGYHVNFTNPQKDTVLLYASLGVSISCVISLLLTGTNLYVAFLVTKKPSPRHFLALAGCVLVAASQSIIFVCQMRGVLGVHLWEMPLDHARWESTLHLAANLLAIPATALAKSGLYVFYHEVIGVTPRAYFILIPAAFSIVAFVVMWIIQLFACTPIEAAWDLRYYTEASCHSRYYCGTAQASVGILADLCITSLAFIRISPLQMPIRGKLEVLSYFFSSLVTLVPTALRLHISVSGHEKENHDPTWDLFWMATYWLYEANCAIICQSLPGLRHLTRSFRKPAPQANCNDSHTPSYSSPPYFNSKGGHYISSEVELYPSNIQETQGNGP